MTPPTCRRPRRCSRPSGPKGRLGAHSDPEAVRHPLRLITPQPPQGPPPLALLLVTGTGAGEQEGRGALFMARALRAPVALLYVANTGPTLQAGREQATAGLMALVQHAAGRLRLPTLHWEASAAGDTLTLARPSDRPPRSVRAWVATAPTRDLRDARGEAFEMPAEHDRYVHRRPLRRGHITAIFGEAEYAADAGPFSLSTRIRLFP